MKRLYIIIMVVLMGSAMLLARPAVRKPADVPQPDGTVVTLCLHGDEYRSFSTTVDGYTVVKGEDGFWRYARKTEDGRLQATGMVARNAEQRSAEEQAFLNGQPKMIAPRMSDAAKRMKEHAAQMVSPLYKDQQGRRSATSIWPRINYEKFKGLVVLVNWNDCEFSLGEGAQDFYQKLTSEKNYRDDSKQYYPVAVEGSVRDYFCDNSLGVFDPTFDVVGPVTLDLSCKYPHPKNEDFTVDEKWAERIFNILKRIMKEVDPLVDFSQYDVNSDGVIDMIYIIFAGYSSNVQGNDVGYIWPHAEDMSAYPTYMTGLSTYDGKKMGRYACSTEFMDFEQLKEQHQYLDGIGTMCHEFSHVLGLADHYDTDYDENGMSNDPGYWDVMAAGTDRNYGLTPAGYNAFERHVLGFCEPEELTVAGTYKLEAFNTSNKAFLLKTGTKDDDFYLENRQKTGWDRFLPGHGLLVWRAETFNVNKWRNNEVNNDASHNLFVMTCNAPQNGKYIDLTSTTDPALVSWWYGKPAVMDLYDITENDGLISFTAGKDLYTPYVEDFESSPLSDDGAQGVEGVYCKWDLSKATIEEKDGGKVAKLLRSGTLTSSIFKKGIRSLRFKVQNGGEAVKFALKVSTDGGAFTAFKTADGKGQVDLKKDTETSFSYINIPENSKIQFNMLSSKTNAVCYLDNIEATFYDNELPTGIEEVIGKQEGVRGSAVYNLNGQRVGTSYKGLIIQNGRKYLIK